MGRDSRGPEAAGERVPQEVGRAETNQSEGESILRLVFQDCHISQHATYPGESGTTQTLTLRALLTRTLAEQLRCKDACFCESGVPRNFKKHVPGTKIANASVNFDSMGEYIGYVRVTGIARPSEAEPHDASLEISFTVDLAGQAPLHDWVVAINQNDFELVVKPPKDWDAQKELEFDGAAEAANEGRDGDALEEHEEHTGGPVLASAVLMGGSHQRKRKAGSGPIVDVNPQVQ
jgi:hypothetical protein